MLWASVIGGGLAYLGAEDSGGGRIGYSSGNYGTLTSQPANLTAAGKEITLVDYRTSNTEIRLRMTGDQTAWLVGKTLYINGDAYAIADAHSVTYSTYTEAGWLPTTTPLVDGRGVVVRLE